MVLVIAVSSQHKATRFLSAPDPDLHLFHHSVRLVRLLDENKRRAGDDRGAGADEGDVGVLDLAGAGAAGGLQGAFDDVPEAVDAPGAEAAAEGVERQLAVEFDAAVLDEIERLAFLAESVAFEPVDHRGREAVVDLRDV